MCTELLTGKCGLTYVLVLVFMLLHMCTCVCRFSLGAAQLQKKFIADQPNEVCLPVCLSVVVTDVTTVVHFCMRISHLLK